MRCGSRSRRCTQRRALCVTSSRVTAARRPCVHRPLSRREPSRRGVAVDIDLQHQLEYSGNTVPLSTPTRSLGSSLVLTVSLAVTAAWSGCAPSPGAGPSRTPTAETKPEPAPSVAPDGGAGGRIFDKWYEGKAFKPDDANTPPPDGSGGPL